MAMNETIKFILQNKDSLNPAVLRTVLDDFGISDNKAEIELLAQENKVYTPAEGKVYNKVTVNVPAPPSDLTTATVTVVVQEGGGLDNNYITLPIINNDALSSEALYNAGTYIVPLYKGTVKGSVYKWVDSVEGDCTVSGHDITITGDCTITFTP